uniref:Uncharacterized protein n=1 Tax=Glossina palpalis gambiensis TaxID=67801 RepID=A0A1B0AQT2_9MUSC
GDVSWNVSGSDSSSLDEGGVSNIGIDKSKYSSLGVILDSWTTIVGVFPMVERVVLERSLASAITTRPNAPSPNIEPRINWLRGISQLESNGNSYSLNPFTGSELDVARVFRCSVIHLNGPLFI